MKTHSYTPNKLADDYVTASGFTGAASKVSKSVKDCRIEMPRLSSAPNRVYVPIVRPRVATRIALCTGDVFGAKAEQIAPRKKNEATPNRVGGRKRNKKRSNNRGVILYGITH